MEPELGQRPENFSESPNNVICGLIQIPSVRIATGVPEEPWDVFEEHARGSTLSDDPRDVRPDPSLVCCSEALPSNGVRLTGKSSRNHLHRSPEGSGIEFAEIRLSKALVQGTLVDARNNSGQGVGFPFRKSDGPVGGQCDAESKLKAADSEAEPKTADFLRAIHMVHPRHGIIWTSLCISAAGHRIAPSPKNLLTILVVQASPHRWKV